jgi:metal-responsive CopG/Arc/MetJ family transcriptional regulator
MVARAKIAISLDPGVLARAEKLCRATGESRSALINRALRALVEQEAQEVRVESYVDAYRRQPETKAEVAAALSLASASLAGVAWDD